MPLKSFRGKLASAAVQRIKLSTNNGLTGYKIKKFDIMAQNPGSTVYEHTAQVHTVDPGSPATAPINFTNPTLLAVGFIQGEGDTSTTNSYQVVFDTMTVNQDIYIGQIDTKDGLDMNYYIELEVIKLDLSEATVATLKDMRGNYTNRDP